MLILYKALKFFFSTSIRFQKVFVVVAVLLNDIFTKYFGKDEPCFLFLHFHHKATTALSFN